MTEKSTHPLYAIFYDCGGNASRSARATQMLPGHEARPVPAGVLVCFVLCAMLTRLSVSLPARASAANSVTAQTTVVLGAAETTFEVPLTLTSDQPYAGAEFALRLPAGLVLKSVRYTPPVVARGQAGPVLARGLYWFSYFSGANDFTGSTQAFLTFEYTGSASIQLTIDHIELMTLSGVSITSLNLASGRSISITRTAASSSEPGKPAGSTKVPTGGAAGAKESSGNTKASSGRTLTLDVANGDAIDTASFVAALLLLCSLTALLFLGLRRRTGTQL
jgi:hypothetical protein